MKIAGLIPARYDSVRFPGKPLVEIQGRPMVQHVYERAVSVSELSAVYVATDDRRIADCVRGFGGKAVMTGEHHASGTDRIGEAAQIIGLENDDIVVNIQGDQPLFSPSVIPLLVQPLIEEPSVPMSTLMWKFKAEADIQNPNHVKVVTDRDGFALYFSRATVPYLRDADRGIAYYKHLGFYGYRVSFLIHFSHLPKGCLESAEKLEQLRALENGYRIKVVETPYNSLEVDVPEDIDRIEALVTDEPSKTPVERG